MIKHILFIAKQRLKYKYLTLANPIMLGSEDISTLEDLLNLGLYTIFSFMGTPFYIKFYTAIELDALHRANDKSDTYIPRHLVGIVLDQKEV